MTHSDRPQRPGRRRVATALGLAPLALTPLALAMGGCATASATLDQPAPPLARTNLRVKLFPGWQNLPFFVAQDQGYFKQQGLDVEIFFTQNSIELRDGLASGDMQIVHSAIDNAVAMKEVAGKDIVVFVGGDGGLNEFFVQPEITAVEQVRGKILIVDAPDTAYALQAFEILRKHGLERGRDYQLKLVGGTFARVGAMLADKTNTASMLNPPFSLQATDGGLRSIGGTVDLIGPYQGSAGFALRPWAMANGPTIERYIAAYVRAFRWSLDPANRQRAVALLADKLKVTPPIAERTYTALINPRGGLARDAKLDDAGFATVLRLRGEHIPQGLTLPLKPERYLDLRWYDAAMARMGRG
jgi:ABC-type nitrate/sulfonate/bicarbonate transport system substrate-binding protein